MSPLFLPRLVAAALALTALAAPLSAGPPTVVVRHAPNLQGVVAGSVQLLLGENLALSGDAAITGDLLLPGTPTLRAAGNASFGAVLPGAGAATPEGYSITLSGNARIGPVRTRVDPSPLPTVAAPARPTGARVVTLSPAAPPAVDFNGLRDLTLLGDAGPVAVPPGVYGDFTAHGGSGFTLGVAGSSVPARYDFQSLTLHGNAALRVVGPVVVTLASGVTLNSAWGEPRQPAWLVLQVYAGGVTLNQNSVLHGFAQCPAGSVTLHGASSVVGGIACDQLSVAGNALISGVADPANQPPVVALTSPADGALFQAPATFALIAAAHDPDGAIARVEFFQQGSLLGAASVFPYQFTVTGLAAGRHTFTARATDQLGASADSSPVTISVADANRPPSVALTTPLAGAEFNFPASITLTATAQDPDGSVARVEFYADTQRLGAATLPPFAWVWSGMLPGNYALSARAYDEQGAMGQSAAATVTILATLPYVTDFEAREGYSRGALDGQGGWVVNGAATNTDQAHYTGERAVLLAATSPATRIAQVFPAYSGHALVYLDFFAQLAAGDTPAASSEVRVEGARLALVRAGTVGELHVFAGNGVGGGAWQRTGHVVALRPDGRAAGWLRLTVRQDFALRQWDLYADGRMIASDVGMVDATVARFARFEVIGATHAEVVFDSLYIGFEHPLFADADQDGMDDAWEVAHGLNPAVNDRHADRDGDGLSNLREFQLGLRPDARDTDGDGLPDGWEVRYGLDPLTPDAGADPDGDGLTNLQEYQLGRDPRKAAVADTTGAVNLRLYSPPR